LRTGMVKLDNEAEDVWDDIQVLQEEIDAYEKKFNELKVSETGKRLIEDEWAVRYFADKWGERLPRQKVAKHCSVLLNELMYAVREALKQTEPARARPAFEISEETWDELEEIEYKVGSAKKDYTRHRRLLNALEASVAEGRPVMPETLDDAAQHLLQKIIEEEFRGRSIKPAGATEQDGRESTGESSIDSIGRESTKLDATDVFNAGRIRPEEQSDLPGRTLGRDTVNDRREPPREGHVQ
jgi:hypothetical protein